MKIGRRKGVYITDSLIKLHIKLSLSFVTRKQKKSKLLATRSHKKSPDCYVYLYFVCICMLNNVIFKMFNCQTLILTAIIWKKIGIAILIL